MASSPEMQLGSIDYYLLGVRQKVDALRTRVSLPAFFTSKKPQNQVRLFFINRAIEIGEACFRIRDLGLPVAVLLRVLCEDFFLLYWATFSEQNAAKYIKFARSETTRTVRALLNKGRMRIRRKSTGAIATKTCVPKLKQFILIKKTVEDIAKESGLSNVYDLLYRFESLEVHAHTFALPLYEGPEDVAAALCSLNGILKVMTLVVDNPAGEITSKEILRILGVENLGGVNEQKL